MTDPPDADNDAQPIDKRGALAARPFSYRLTGERVLISWRGRTIKTLAGDAASRFRSQVAEADDDAAQLLMAKRTGNFKHGNEKQR